jgi:NAD(P)H dehydrogenase (quinone)
LTVYANSNPKSFCHAILDQFTRGLEKAGRTNEVVDLYAMKFDPVLKARDFPNWIDENMPLETLKHMILENSGGSIQRTVLERWLRNKDSAYISNLIRRLRPKDVVEQQKKVEHVYFYSVGAVGDAVRQSYLQEAYRLGKEYC